MAKFSPTQSIRQDVLILALEFLFYGFYCVVMVQSTYLLVNGGMRNRGRKIFLVATIVMFSAATTQQGLQLAYVLKTLPYDANPALEPPEGLTDTRNHLQTAFNSLSRLAFLFSDAIVCWRAWVLWSYNRKVVAFLGTLFFLTLACEAIDLGLGIARQYGGKVVNDQGFASNVRAGLVLPLVVPTLVINASATSLIAWMAWHHRRDIRSHVTDGSTQQGTVEKILTLFVESGIFYCIVWVIYLLGAAGMYEGKVGYNVMAAVISQLSCIYPTVIIVLVCLQRTHCERHFTYTDASTTVASELEFAHKPGTQFTLSRPKADTHTQFSSTVSKPSDIESGGGIYEMEDAKAKEREGSSVL